MSCYQPWGAPDRLWSLLSQKARIVKKPSYLHDGFRCCFEKEPRARFGSIDLLNGSMPELPRTCLISCRGAIVVVPCANEVAFACMGVFW